MASIVSQLAHPIPVWVSRKTADGDISQFEVPLWMFLFIGTLVLLNVLLWGSIGVIVAGRLILGGFA